MYRLLHPTQPNSGMFAFIWQTLRGMYHYPNDKYYVWFGQESCYYDNDMLQMQQINNVWDYYFEQPHTKITPQPFHIISEVGLLHDSFSEFRDIYLSPETYATRRKEYSDIIQKYVKPLPHINAKVQSFCENNFKGKTVLGVHCRGTDHPDKQPIEHYIERIREYESDYDVLFVTSDEQNRVDKITQAFGNKVITYPTTIRSVGDMPLHYANNFVCSKYYVGEDVIVEAYLLAKTNKLLCCTNSNVNYYVRALNTNLPYKLIDK